MKKAVITIMFLAALSPVASLSAQTLTMEEQIADIQAKVAMLMEQIKLLEQIEVIKTQIAEITAKQNATETSLQNVGISVGSLGPATSTPTAATPYIGLSKEDQDAIATLIPTLPDTLSNACSRSTSGRSGDYGWAERRSYDRIFRLACEQIKK